MALSIQLAAATKYNYESEWVKITTARKNLAKSSKDQQGPAAKGKQGGKAENQAVETKLKQYKAGKSLISAKVGIKSQFSSNSGKNQVKPT